MSRVLAFLLAFTLLFQASWAVAATYCGHETVPATAGHFGHHAHEHKTADGKKQVDAKLAVDDDCAACHAAHAALLPVGLDGLAARAPASADFPVPSLHGSALARAPDRPQWPRLA